MIPPVVQPGNVFQRVRLPDTAGVAGDAMRIASISGDLAQYEWYVSFSDWLAIYAQTTDPFVIGQPYNDGSYLRFSNGPPQGIGAAIIGSTFIIG